MSEKPKVLLLGDSIRMSYQPVVARLMEAEAVVVGPADNGQFSLYTLSSLKRWFAELGTPQVVHWNNGLHDVGYNPGRCPVQIPLDMYLANLDLTLTALRAVTPRVIWATSTPVHPNRPFLADQWSWRNEEVDRYNAAALDLMKRRGVPVNDLHALVWRSVDEYLAEDQLHLSEAGQTACGQAVAEAVRREMRGA